MGKFSELYQQIAALRRFCEADEPVPPAATGVPSVMPPVTPAPAAPERNIGVDYKELKRTAAVLLKNLQRAFETYEAKTAQFNKFLGEKVGALSAAFNAGATAQTSVEDQAQVITDLSAQIDALKKTHAHEIDKAKQEIEGLRQQLTDVAASASAGEEAAKGLGDKLKGMEANAAESQARVTKLEAEVSQLVSRLDKAKGRIETFNQLKKALESRIEQLDAENGELVEKHNALRDQFNDLLANVKGTTVYTPKPKKGAEAVPDEVQPEHLRGYGGFDILEHLRLAHEEQKKPRPK
jgi:chromosome segregation ATPase